MNEKYDIKNIGPKGRDGKPVNPEFIIKGVAPIIGTGSSFRILERGYLDLGPLAELSSRIEKGFSLGFDIATESYKQMCICATSSSNGAAFSININVDNTPNRLSVNIRDDEGKTLQGIVDLTPWVSKRMVICIDTFSNSIEFSEFTIHEIIDNEMRIVQADSPRLFSEFDRTFTAGGCYDDTDNFLFFEGRLAKIAVLPLLDKKARKELTQVSLQEIKQSGFNLPRVEINQERRSLFLQDLDDLREMTQKSSFNDKNMRLTSAILYRWLFEPGKPMLPGICSELGLQLAFPGATLREREYVRKLQKYEPTFVQRGEIGDLFGREWIPIDLFRKEPSFYLRGKPISIEALVKFVRHKLGGAHFDPVDRKRWQKELKFLTDRIALMQSGAMNYQMAAIAKSVVTAIDSCGIEYALRRA